MLLHPLLALCCVRHALASRMRRRLLSCDIVLCLVWLERLKGVLGSDDKLRGRKGCDEDDATILFEAEDVGRRGVALD